MEIHIEMCTDCDHHQWHYPHKKENYTNTFDLLRQKLTARFPGITILRNTKGPARIGAFEITQGGRVLFSKLKEQRWPSAKEVIDRLTSEQDPGQAQAQGQGRLSSQGQGRTRPTSPLPPRREWSRNEGVDFQKANLESLQRTFHTTPEEQRLY
jgi:selT/selW/selH-like putative selenoprotein